MLNVPTCQGTLQDTYRRCKDRATKQRAIETIDTEPQDNLKLMAKTISCKNIKMVGGGGGRAGHWAGHFDRMGHLTDAADTRGRLLPATGLGLPSELFPIAL